MKCHYCGRGNSKGKGINKLKAYMDGNGYIYAHAVCRQNQKAIAAGRKLREQAKQELIFEPVSADYTDFEGFLEQLKPALERLGISMIDDPDFEGTDSYGILLSNRPMTEQEVKEQSIHHLLGEE